jgi:selenocysteine lyase/cysteine desulfurase
MSFKAHFSRALAADPERVHFAAHSHHLWPDVSFDAHVRAWEDAAKLADRKWDKVFGEIIPSAQRSIARILGSGDPSSIAFAPNTHDFVRRILSCLDGRPRILTTTSEFHSFARQTARLEEDGAIEIVRVPAEPFATLSDRLAAEAAKSWDLVFFSHVLFDSGFAVDFERVCAAVTNPKTLLVVDGYHGFCAIPTRFGPLASRAFYLAGGYKYAMSGEGCCFLHAPNGYGERPRDTGWFASFGTLAEGQTGVPYASGGARFFGATFDPTALHRLAAVLAMLEREGIDAARIRSHVRTLQHAFIREIGTKLPFREADLLVPMSDERRGQFLAFRTPEAGAIQKTLESANVIVDSRGDRLRFGFGIYHDEDDIARGVARIAQVLR